MKEERKKKGMEKEGKKGLMEQRTEEIKRNREDGRKSGGKDLKKG